MAASGWIQPLVLKSPYPQVSHWFDVEKYSNAILVIPGLERPLRVYKTVLIKASRRLGEMIQQKEKDVGKHCEEASHFEWMFDKSATNSQYLNVLLKWLRFCYGEEQSFSYDECSAALAVLFQLKLIEQDHLKNEIEKYMVYVAKKGLRICCNMLIECATVYDECHQDSLTGIDHILAKLAFKSEFFDNYYGIVVDGCLMKLPDRYFADAKFGKAHTIGSEFAVCLKYVLLHSGDLSIEKRRELLLKCNDEEIGPEEIAILLEQKILEPESLEKKCVRAMSLMEERAKVNTLHKKAELRRKAAVVKLHTIEGTSSSPTTIKTGHGYASGNGAVYHDAGRIIVSVYDWLNRCRDLHVTHVVDGSTDIKAGLIPFCSTSHCLIYDGEQNVYVCQTSIREEGRRFGRVNLDTFKFEELAPFPHIFAVTFSGCYHDGKVFVVDSHSFLCYYDVSKGKWYGGKKELPHDDSDVCIRLLNDPHNKSNRVFLMKTGKTCDSSGLFGIDLGNHSEISLISRPPVAYDMVREALIQQVDIDDFFVIAALKNGAWYRYSSKNDVWTYLPNWKPCNGDYNHNYLVFSLHDKSFYYHIHKKKTWETVHV